MKNITFAFPYFSEVFLLATFTGIIHISFWWLLLFFICDHFSFGIIQKHIKDKFLFAFPIFSPLFFFANILGYIHGSYWWLIWFILTDITTMHSMRRKNSLPKNPMEKES
jgi:hypothetical protein